MIDDNTRIIQIVIAPYIPGDEQGPQSIHLFLVFGWVGFQGDQLPTEAHR